MDLSNSILSDITAFMKYSRYLPAKKRRESWSELVDRNKQMHIDRFPKLKKEIEVAYKLVYDKKILPSMRALQFAGKPVELNNTRLYNCCFLPIDHLDAFSELMFLLLSGTGVGYSVQRHHVGNLPTITKPTKTKRYLVGDSIEGWADAVKMLMKAYFNGKPLPLFDFRDIRVKGAMLLTSGGKAPGPEPLNDCLHNVQKILDRKQTGETLSTLEVHDICCYIADAVLAGGIRRCLPTYYSVKMADGSWKQINLLKIGESVSYNGKSHKITSIYENGVQEIVKINLTDGTWHCSTPNHRWLVMNHETKKLEWMEAQLIRSNLNGGKKISFVKED